MRKIDEDTYEVVTIVSPNKTAKVGDGFRSEEELIVEMAKDGWTLREAHHDDPRDEHWSGYSHWTRTGRPLSEVSLWD